MQFNIIKGLIIIGFSAFFIFSCKDDGDIRLPNQEEFLDTRLIDTFTVETSTILWENEINTNNPNFVTVGEFTDPLFGKVRAYTNFNVSSTDEFRDFGASAVCDSVYLTLPYGALTFDGERFPVVLGDTLSSMELEVYELIAEINNEAIYKPSDSIPTSDVVIGTFTGNLYPNSGDLKIVLDNTFGQNILDNGSNLSLADFRANFNGLSLKAKKGSDGAVYSLNVETEFSFVRMYYSNSVASTLSFDMLISNASVNHIESEKSGDLASLVNDGDEIPSSTTNRTYMQAGTGIGTRIQVSQLQQFLAENPNLAINKALFIIPTDINTFNNQLDYPPMFVELVKSNASGELLRNTEEDLEKTLNFSKQLLGATNYIFNYDPDNDLYSCNVTSFMQGVALSKESFDGFVMYPAYNNSWVHRCVLLDYDGVDGAYLKFYFTEVK